MLLYLTAWDEDVPPFSTHKRSWKGYNFNVLNSLTDDGLIVGTKKSKSVFLTDEGAARAKELIAQYMANKMEVNIEHP